MAQTLAVDANNDIYIGADGNLATASGLTAVLQAAQQAAQTVLGEMVLAVDQGVPYFELVWSGSPRLAQLDAYLRRALTTVDGVQAVAALDIQASGGAVSYRADIETIYGTGVVNGSV